MRKFLIVAALGAGVSGCTAGLIAGHAPESLRPPETQKLAAEWVAYGVQVYECNGAEWKFKGPEASLVDRGGRVVGRHYGGPTWEANDGSKVVGEVRARQPSPDPRSIPLLLLAAKSSSDSGTLANVRSVQRLETHGGIEPARSCTSAEADEVARVPYRAIYRFYAEAR